MSDALWPHLASILVILLLLHCQPAAARFDLDLNEPAQAVAEEEQVQENGQAPMGAAGLWLAQQSPLGRLSTGSSWLKTTLNKLPDYFDFERFMKRFGRSYSANELLYRKSVFLMRCLQVFKSRLTARLGAHLSSLGQWWSSKPGQAKPSTYVQGITTLADRSPNEIKRMFMRGPPIEFRPKEQSESEYYQAMRQRNAEINVWDAELESRASLDELDSGTSDLPIEASQLGEAPVFSELEAWRTLEKVLQASKHDRQLESAIVDELAGREVDSMSRASADDLSESADWQKLAWPGSYLNGPLSEWNKQRRSLRLPDLNSPAQPQATLDSPRAGGDQVCALPKMAPDDAGLDWSNHGCLSMPAYDQGQECGKCYVLAATTLAEFYKCTEQVNVLSLRKFSKDYLLDCGQKYAASLQGCMGGSLFDALKFMSEAGTHNVQSWCIKRKLERDRMRALGFPVKGLDFKCPLNKYETPLSQWGQIEVGIEPEVVSVADWMLALRDGPLVASVQMPAVGLETYAGGVHDGQGCADSRRWHSMLLVGYGRSELDDTPFWRFRNSYGPHWGDRGHFELAMSVPSECLAGGVRVYRRPRATG